MALEGTARSGEELPQVAPIAIPEQINPLLKAKDPFKSIKEAACIFRRESGQRGDVEPSDWELD